MVAKKVRPSPIISRVSDIDEDPVLQTPSVLKVCYWTVAQLYCFQANNVALTLKSWIDFYQSWIAATSEEKAMFPEAMFAELCVSFETEKLRRYNLCVK